MTDWLRLGLILISVTVSIVVIFEVWSSWHFRKKTNKMINYYKSRTLSQLEELK